MKKSLVIFVVSFALNLLWEEAHHALYAAYQGGEITHSILLRAALADAVMVSALLALARAFFANQTIFIVFAGIVLAVWIELFALKTGRWAYGALMPIIPFLGVGLSPTIQLAVTGLLTGTIARGGRETNTRT